MEGIRCFSWWCQQILSVKSIQWVAFCSNKAKYCDPSRIMHSFQSILGTLRSYSLHYEKNCMCAFLISESTSRKDRQVSSNTLVCMQVLTSSEMTARKWPNVSGKSKSMMDAMLGVCDSLRQNAGCPSALSVWKEREMEILFLAESSALAALCHHKSFIIECARHPITYTTA